MIYVYPIILILSIELVFTGLLLLNNKTNIKFNHKKILKGMIIALAAIMFIKCFLNDEFIRVINKGGELYGYYSYNRANFFESFSRWIILFSEILALSLLYSDNKIVKTILFYICLPLTLLTSIVFGRSVYYFITIMNNNTVVLPTALTVVILILEMVLLTNIPLYTKFIANDELSIKGKKEWISAVKIGLFGLFICVPFLFFPSVFGYTNLYLNFGTTAHIGWIIATISIYCIIYFCFKNEDVSIRKSLMAILVFNLFYHFTGCFKVGVTTNRLPFQLCNLATYLFVIVLFFDKKQHLFNFLFIANPVGALIAIVTLSDHGYIFEYWIIHYIILHLWVMLIPILFISLKIKKFPSIKETLVSFAIWMNIYFFSMLFLNVFINQGLNHWFSGWGMREVNFFYLIDCPVKDVLPFYKDLQVLRINLFGETYYIVYLLFIYVVFTLLSFLLYYIQVGAFKLSNLVSTKLNEKNA